MKIFETDDLTLVSLTVEEEQSMAMSVMDCISLRWVSGEFQELLDRIYRSKCKYGSVIRVDDLLRLLWFYDFYDIEHPEIIDNELDISSDLDVKDYKGSWDDLNVEARRTVIMVWREVWSSHKAIRDVADAYKDFPGDGQRLTEEQLNKADIEEQKILEQYFWEEVDKVEREYDCSRHDAITMVKDYIPRGDFSIL